jgi:ferredoxin
MVKITHEKWKCVMCGACAGTCPEFWEMGSDGKAHLKGAEYKKVDEGELGELTVDDAKCNKAAADGCPANCIHVEEGEQKEKAAPESE